MQLVALHVKITYRSVSMPIGCGPIGSTSNFLMEIVETNVSPQIRAEAGETLGWLGDPRNLKEFVHIEGGECKLSLGKVKIRPFEIGKYPVTNQWYEEFIRAGAYENKEYWTNEGKKWLEKNKIKEPQYWNDRTWKCGLLFLIPGSL